MATNRLGPWSWKDYEDFLALDVEVVPKVENGLLAQGLFYGLGATEPSGGPQFEWWKNERDRLANRAWAARKAHPVYKSLSADPNFRAAWNVFERSRKSAKEGELASRKAPLLFLREFVRHAGHVHKFPGRAGKSSYGAYAKRRRAAERHAGKLSALLQNGIGLKDFFDTEKLRDLLARLGSELRNTKRKEYGGSRYFERWILKSLAHSLVLYCGVRSPAVIVHFARMHKIACEPKTAQRYCNEAAKRWRESLAATLRATPSSDGQKTSLM